MQTRARACWGCPQARFYEAYRPTLLALAHTHKLVAQKKRAPALLKEYKALLKTHAALERQGSYHRALLSFYKDTTQDLDLAEQVGEPPSVLTAYAGFWIRRMADGTADEFAQALKDIIKTHDQPNAAVLYGD